MKEVKAASLVLDFDLYPRNNLDAKNVANIVDALNAGIELPPVVVDRKTKRVVDGFHRVRAYLRLYGESAIINCVERTYKSEAEMVLDAIRYNASHGAKLDPCDRVHCCHLAERLGIPLESVAVALSMSVDKLATLSSGRTARNGANQPVALKNTVRHFAGRRLNKRQKQANAKLGGMNQVYYANQLIELIESDMLDKDNESLLEQLRYLHALLDGVLAAV